MHSTPRDANFTPVFSAEGDNGITYPWSIDSITGRVLIEAVLSTDTSPSDPKVGAQRDANFKTVLTGVSDIDPKQSLSAAIDHENQFLAVDILVE